MSQDPQRPFVPHRTPKVALATITASEFRLYRPFLPGAREPALSATVRSIDHFLDASSPPVVGYPQERGESSYANEPADLQEELPPVEHFLDPLPIVQHFAPDTEGALSDAWPPDNEAPPAETRATEPSESGWSETDWQNFDWRAAAALGEGPDAAASNAWATTDWDEATPRPQQQLRQSAAHAIATALDQIAQRIRDGDPSAVADPEKIAATLAALLRVGVRR